MKKKLISLLCVASLLIGLLAGCGSSGSAQTANGAKPAADKSASGTIQVGIVLPTKDEPRWLQDQAQFESILSDAGFTNQVMFSQGSSATEKTNVETLISKGISVLIICAQDGAAAAAAVEAAKAAGVTVIAYDRLITGTDAVDYYVTFDSFAVGAAQGQYLVDNAPAGSGIPLYLYAGAATDNNAFIFFEGAWSVLQPKIADGTFVIENSSEAEALQNKAELTRDEVGKIVGQVTTDWDFNVAKSTAVSQLTGNKMLDIIIGKYTALCSKNGLDFNAKALTSNLSFVHDSDISAMVGNLLDNAFEAAKQAENGKIEFSLYTIDGKSCVVSVINTALTAPKCENENLVSAKPDAQSHGYGIKSIKKTAEKYGGSYSWFYDDKNREFHAMVMLPIPSASC